MTQENVQSISPMTSRSLINMYIDYTGQIASGEMLRKWMAIWAVSASAERRVWLDLPAGKVYPNLFIFFITPPGVGKDQAISPMIQLINKVGRVNLSPTSMSDKGMLDTLADPSAIKDFIPKGGIDKITYHSLNICAPELGTLFTKQDLGFLSIINDLFNCGPSFKEKIRSRDDTLTIQNPHLTILGGTQPKFLSSLFPPESWGMGFMARVIMIYHGIPEKKSLFFKKEGGSKGKEKALLERLKQISEMSGPMTMTEETETLLDEWHMEGSEEDKPQHPKLMHYNTRRILHLLKLSMIMALAEGRMEITADDFHAAHEELLGAESKMPEIFKEMSSQGQKDIIDDAFYFLTILYKKNGKKPVSEHRLVQFLSQHVPTNQISYIVDSMVKMKLIKEEGGLNDTRPSAQRTRIRMFVPQTFTNIEL